MRWLTKLGSTVFYFVLALIAGSSSLGSVPPPHISLTVDMPEASTTVEPSSAQTQSAQPSAMQTQPVEWVPIGVASSTSYSQSGSNIYWDKELVAGADLETFRVSPSANAFSESEYAVDYDHAYCNGLAIGGADLRSFTTIQDRSGNDSPFAKDANRAYSCIEVIPGADVRTFTVVDDELGNWTDYCKDARHVYYSSVLFGTSIVLGADPSSFVGISDPGGLNGPTGSQRWLTPYAKDKNAVYYVGTVVAGADPKTFALIGGYAIDADGSTYDATDKSHRFLNSTIVP